MNVALSSRHTVHANANGGPACHAFGAPHASEAYRVTTREVSCKKCLKIQAAAVKVEVVEIEVVEEIVETVEIEITEMVEAAEVETVQAATDEPVIVAEVNGRAPVWMTIHQGRQMWTAKGVRGLYTSKARALAAYERVQAAASLQR